MNLIGVINRGKLMMTRFIQLFPDALLNMKYVSEVWIEECGNGGWWVNISTTYGDNQNLFFDSKDLALKTMQKICDETRSIMLFSSFDEDADIILANKE